MKVYIYPEVFELVPLYLKRRNDDVENLRSFIETEDFDSVQTIGHKLYGNGTMYGFDQISNVGKGLETAAIEKDLSKIVEHTQELFEYLKNLEICPLKKMETHENN